MSGENNNNGKYKRETDKAIGEINGTIKEMRAIMLGNKELMEQNFETQARYNEVEDKKFGILFKAQIECPARNSIKAVKRDLWYHWFLLSTTIGAIFALGIFAIKQAIAG